VLTPFKDLVGWIGFVDQDGTITDQLNHGIRAFDLRLVTDENKVAQLCHARHEECQSEHKFVAGVKAILKKDWKHPKEAWSELESKVFNNVAMAFSSPDAVFEEFHRWIAAHPNEVVTINAALVSSNLSMSYLEGQLDKHKLRGFLHSHAKGKAWATLGEMIAHGQRLVVFSGKGNQKGDINDIDSLTVSLSKGWDGKWKTSDVIADCGDLQPAAFAAADAVIEFDHHLTMSIARLRDRHFNTSALQQHLFNCHEKYKKAPTYLYVDFFKDSWVVKLAEDANRGVFRKP
jgi:hypothetical protein